VGIEALARWKRGNRIVYPADFIPVAERAGLVLEVDRHIAQTATNFVSSLHDGMSLSINASALHFKHQAAFEELHKMLDTSCLTKRKLSIELTETAFMSLPEGAAEFVQQVHALGVGIHLDDFGTGYSSLSYLQHLHVDALKIDRSFVTSMLHEKRARQIVEAVVQLAQRFGIETIAEGIETAAQEQALRDLGVSMGQGFFYGPALPAEELLHTIGALRQP
jgi:EAL domain-containing protein (putative c-di-GMP-specific phosphodiesterase class I)